MPAWQNADRHGVALKGYDPVAYFDGGNPTPGRKDLTAEHDGVTYRFATEAHREAFIASPEKYAPQYGGWCAKAIAEGKKVEINPKTFKITNGRLFLFYNGLLGNALPPWTADEANYIVKADANWPTIKAEK
ncbi:MAG: hypothetical protein GC162_14400 [Planctomycetes bacterium]|nr:hypothetical protein [Planctomycetota bacterium]